MGDYRVHDLARLGGCTVRNVRAYRERGLLAPPRLVGRTGWYDDGHLARLRLITRLLGRGYSLTNIAELLSAWESNRPVADVLGIERVLTRPLSTDEPQLMSRAEVAELLGLPTPQVPFERLARLGVVDADGTKCLVRRPALLRIARELMRAGLPTDVVVDLAAYLIPELDAIARRLVQTTNATLFASRDTPASVEEVDARATRLLALAADAVSHLFNGSLEAALAGELGESVAGRMAQREAVLA